jgi:hypothetical protein
LFVTLFRGDFRAFMHIDIHPPLYVTKTLLDVDISSWHMQAQVYCSSVDMHGLPVQQYGCNSLVT